MKVSWAGLLLIPVLAGPPARTQTPPPAAQMAPAAKVALTPPMGWNSWDAYGLTITEQQFRANVKVEANELKSFGWNYAVIDEGWFFKDPEDRPKPELLQYQIDANGRYVPVPARFPSAGTAPASPSAARRNRWHPRLYTSRHNWRRQFQATRRLGPLPGPQVRHPHRSRNPARLG